MKTTLILASLLLGPVTVALHGAEPAGMAPEIVSVEVNDRLLPKKEWAAAVGGTGRSIELDSCRSLHVTFRENPQSGRPSHRLRYCLEGVDLNWRVSVGHMQLAVRFLDEGWNIIATEEHNFNGESSGWRGNVHDSIFSPRVLTLTAPPRSAHLQLFANSANPQTVGIYAFRDLSIGVQSPGEPQPRLFKPSMETGLAMDDPAGAPANWARSGSRAQLAQVVRLPDGTHALAIVDDDALAFGAWILPGQVCPAIKAGDSIRVEWRECVSTGGGGSTTLIYGPLAAGSYRLRLGCVTAGGVEVPGETRLLLTVLPPWWARPAVWGVVAFLGVALSAWTVRVVTRRRLQRRLDEAERRAALERERARIARDIHDDLGASLAQIAILSNLAQKSATGDPTQQGQLAEISTRARESVRKLDEIVWAVNPARDSLEHLVSYLCKFAEDYLALAGVRFRVDIPDELPHVPLDSATRHHVFLAAREAIHNAVRHGHPGTISLRVAVENASLVVEIKDDGCGFDPAAALSAGRGVVNMRERMSQAGGTLNVSSTPGKGSTLQFILPLTNLSDSHS